LNLKNVLGGLSLFSRLYILLYAWRFLIFCWTVAFPMLIFIYILMDLYGSDIILRGILSCFYSLHSQVSSPTIIVERAGSYAWTHKSWRVREEFVRTVATAVGLFASTELPLQRVLLSPVLQLLNDLNQSVRDAAISCIEVIPLQNVVQLTLLLFVQTFHCIFQGFYPHAMFTLCTLHMLSRLYSRFTFFCYQDNICNGCKLFCTFSSVNFPFPICSLCCLIHSSFEQCLN
jgi:hypothetical protein